MRRLIGTSKKAVPRNNPIPGAVITIQTFGDFIGFNPTVTLPTVIGPDITPIISN